MRSVKMLDLHAQYLRLKDEIDAAMATVLERTDFIGGQDVKEFEKELAAYHGSTHAIACGNGTDAIQIALMAMDLPPGSEVITPGFSYAAIAEMCLLIGLKPVYCDLDPNTYLMNVEDAEKRITSKTRVLAPVHLFGQNAPMEAILALAQKHNLYVLEDNAQAIGSVYTFAEGKKAKSGSMGHVSTTSFFPSKNLGCYGDGGAIVTSDEALAKRCKMIANHGQSVKYHHEVIGMNSRLDTLQAAILRVKLRKLDQFAAERQAAAEHYDRELGAIPQIQIPARAEDSTHVFHQYCMVMETPELRTALQEYLKNNGIPSMIYYPLPLYKQVAYQQDVTLPVTEYLCNRIMALPMGTDMETEQLEYITSTIKNYFSTLA
ncbi:MAG: DegT/DnrJ/EryC1/StrS family aminotransferase [Sphingomonadales bacterium]|nr:DegT/DnrJ/EryC1/StrS family aminotransferase [Sphingomonadales bacterium]